MGDPGPEEAQARPRPSAEMWRVVHSPPGGPAQAQRERADAALRDRAEIEASLAALASTLEGRMKGMAAQVTPGAPPNPSMHVVHVRQVVGGMLQHTGRAPCTAWHEPCNAHDHAAAVARGDHTCTGGSLIPPGRTSTWGCTRSLGQAL